VPAPALFLCPMRRLGGRVLLVAPQVSDAVPPLPPARVLAERLLSSLWWWSRWRGRRGALSHGHPPAQHGCFGLRVVGLIGTAPVVAVVVVVRVFLHRVPPGRVGRRVGVDGGGRSGQVHAATAISTVGLMTVVGARKVRLMRALDLEKVVIVF
jgi:hypothetical protein